MAKASFVHGASVLAAALGLGLQALPVRAQRALPALQPVSSLLPSDAELERDGARIGVIEIDNQDVFDPRDPREVNALFRLSNILHVETRPELIERKLLFKRDDLYSRRLLDESARILRAERYFYNAEIVPVRYADHRVDVRVTTRDVWSLNPGVSFGRRGGKSSYGVDFEELNLLGRGVSVGFHHQSGVDRDVRRIEFADRHLLGRRLELTASHASNSDGGESRLSLERPFYALDSRYAVGADVARFDRIDSLYSLGRVDARFRERGSALNVHGGWSDGLRDGWVRRWLLGYSVDRHRFEALPGDSPSVLPETRDLSYPWVGFEVLQDEYATLRNHDQIGRTEDFLLGTRMSARLGYSSDGVGAGGGALVYHAAFDRGFAPSPLTTLTLASTLDGRWQDGRARDLWFESDVRYYYQQSDRWLLFANLDASYGHALDPDHQMLLGGDNGLRGYPLRYQGGDKRVNLTIEQRYFSDWYPLRLFRAGAAVFFDAGRTFGDDPLGTPNHGTLKDIGFGLRLGNTRTGGGNVIHIDVAFPLDGPDELSATQFLIETRKEF